MAIKEFSLAELLDDPMVGLIMERDGVERRSLECLLDKIGSIYHMTNQTIDKPDRGSAAAIPCDRDPGFDKDRMDEREMPVQDRPEPGASPVKEPLSDDEWRDPSPLCT